jgi:hypothetical protein
MARGEAQPACASWTKAASSFVTGIEAAAISPERSQARRVLF